MGVWKEGGSVGGSNNNDVVIIGIAVVVAAKRIKEKTFNFIIFHFIRSISIQFIAEKLEFFIYLYLFQHLNYFFFQYRKRPPPLRLNASFPPKKSKKNPPKNSLLPF